MRNARSLVRFSCIAVCLSALASPTACQPSEGDSAPRAAAARATSNSGGLRALLVTGANNHDWEWTSPRLRRVLEASGRFEVEVTNDPATTLADLEALKGYDVLVLDYNAKKRWGEPAESNFLEAVRGGVGVAVIHAANNAFPGWEEYEKMVALCWRKGTGHGRFHKFDVNVIDRDHPLTADMPDMIGHPDELYHKLVHMHDAPYRVLAVAMSSESFGGTGRPEPMILVTEYGKGRIFHTPLGHVWRKVPASRASYADPHFRQLVARGAEWAATGEVTIPAVPPNQLSAAEREAGFELLFDGRTSGGWRGFRQDGFPDKGWIVEDGALKCLAKGGGGDLITTKQYEDFDFRFEWAVTKGANSGIIYLCDESEGTTWRTGPEYQVLDDGERPRENLTSAGALYALVKPQGVVLRPLGQFNAGRIVVRDGTVEHWLNGVKVLESSLEDDEWRGRVQASKFGKMPKFGTVKRGHIALQDHGNEVRYRSLRIAELE